MKKVYLFLPLLAAIIFIYSAYHLFTIQLSDSSLKITRAFKGFDDKATDDYSKLLEKYHTKIQEHSRQADLDQRSKSGELYPTTCTS